ncbi:RNA polymerase recycling motor HelD [Geosporobacter ferrireducens]|uniref:RNA polymerase recycling motor HelD n=1 Tax=Geosporobacter ferrireducens TaxID=1424294 RepID=UPI00139CAC9A|nr:RNA polymerase recycling motor HelD [Geosporobacter ferrireducens]MTI54606.1 DNA helicase UvrD [Geosporobacter ferrireducens]
MEAKVHPKFEEEDIHLRETIQWIEEEEAFLQDYEEILKGEIAEIRKTVTTLMDERLIAKQQLHQIAAKNVENLKKIEGGPYFGRIDFQERNRDEIEEIYIGKFGLMDKEQDIPVVVDWRAPIADVYYSGLSKNVSYRAPYGEVRGIMHLKRRYEIHEGQLEQIFDEKVSEEIIEESLKGKGDFLTEALNKTTQGRLKEIVATIQDQQNRIIRSEMIKPLVVQGVAGSGKTTIALHRMAYLIYNNRRNMEEARYMVMAPNKLFLNYISDILPDLGVENVMQTTFEDWAMKLTGLTIDLERWSDPINQLTGKAAEVQEKIKLASKIKGSLLFKRVIDHRLLKLQENLLPKEDLSFEGIPLMGYGTLQEVFNTSNVHLSIDERIKKLQDYLKRKFKRELPEIRQQIENFYQEKIENLKGGTQNIDEIRPKIIEYYDERDKKIASVQQKLTDLVDTYMVKVKSVAPITFYCSLFEEPDEMRKAFGSKIGEKEIEVLCHREAERLKKGMLQPEDLGPLAYLQIRLSPHEDKKKYAHIVVDEAQDFDEFKMSILREFSMNDSFTFVGDLAQGIYSYRGIRDWKRSMERVFPDKEYNYHLLTTSYRSTIEIIELANAVIKLCSDLKAVLAEPILRHGERPKWIQCSSEAEMIEKVFVGIKTLHGEGMNSIAIICKDLEETGKAYNTLKEKLEDLHLITDQATDFQGGTVVIPSYLSKGLEFDGVILWNAAEESYTMNPIDIKLFYIGITRALHRLYLYNYGETSPVLKAVKGYVTV